MEFLRSKGYQVVELTNSTKEVIAIVVGGGHNNLLADKQICLKVNEPYPAKQKGIISKPG